MNLLQRFAMIAARILVARIFTASALNIIGQTLAAHEMAAHGVPASIIAALIMTACSANHLGYGPDLWNLPPHICSCSVTVPATLMAHEFWQVVGTPLYPVQLINFSKNACSVGEISRHMGGNRRRYSRPRIRITDFRDQF